MKAMAKSTTVASNPVSVNPGELHTDACVGGRTSAQSTRAPVERRADRHMT